LETFIAECRRLVDRFGTRFRPSEYLTSGEAASEFAAQRRRRQLEQQANE
jgi:hypothetical protein